jgi:hypothetical protein
MEPRPVKRVAVTKTFDPPTNKQGLPGSIRSAGGSGIERDFALEFRLHSTESFASG